MTPERRLELRDWAAIQLMGWKKKISITSEPYYVKPDGKEEHHWAPDSPDAPASQILGVIERMRESGWKVVMGNNLDRSYFADFRSLSYPVPFDNFYAEADTIPEAILEAAMATPNG